MDSATENVMYLVLNPKTKHYDIYAKIKGTNGLVPAPPAGAQGKFLRGDGTWQPLVSYGEATATNAGLMSAADKTKLDGLVLATSAEVKAMLDEVFAEA